MTNDKYQFKLNALINRFIYRSTQFVNYSTDIRGLTEKAFTGNSSSFLSDDHEYFNFTKSTKLLKSIRTLFKIGHNEDALILVRSIFECYLSSRFLNENENENKFEYDLKEQLVINPIYLENRMFFLDTKTNLINDRSKNVKGYILPPSSFPNKKDKSYYHEFYSFLSMFAHSNMGIIDYYIDTDHRLSILEENENILFRFYTVFVFTKIFACTVTVEGEDFYNENAKKECYLLVNDSLDLQNELLTLLIEYFSSSNKINKKKNVNTKKMLKKMKNSLEYPIIK